MQAHSDNSISTLTDSLSNKIIIQVFRGAAFSTKLGGRTFFSIRQSLLLIAAYSCVKVCWKLDQNILSILSY
jgi:hypothetical protein